MLRRLIPIALAVVASLALGVSPAVAKRPFPDTITLTSDATATTGFRAEGIVARGTTAYAGSLATGTIVRADLRTGEVTTLVEAADGPALGLALRGDTLFVAGGPTGQLRVYDTDDGELLHQFQLPGAALINDVTVAPDAVYATDSFNATLYRVPFLRHGELGEPVALTLTGDFVLADGFNSNGIVDTGPGELILAQTADPIDGVGSVLYAVSVEGTDAVADRIELDGDLVGADGLVRRGRTLYVVENEEDRIAKVRLAGDLGSGTVVETFTDDDAATPTTASFALGALYAVNARFADIEAGADPATLDYDIIRVDVR
jgi:hypothetical protein